MARDNKQPSAPADGGTGIAAAMNAANENNPPKAWLIVGGFKLEPKPNEYTGKTKGAPTYKRVGFCHAQIPGTDLAVPMTVSVVFPADGSKPSLEAKFVGQRYPQLDGIEIMPNIPKQRAADAEHRVKTFRREVASAFHAWYRQQSDVPAITSRVTGTDSAAGVTLDD